MAKIKKSLQIKNTWGGANLSQSLINKGKNNKNLAIDSFWVNTLGFTLIEVIAIIILLSVIALITYPIINNLIGDSKEDLYNKQISELERLANTWAVQNVKKLKMEAGYSYNLSFDELYEQGIIVLEDIKNPKTGENLTGCIKISYNLNNEGYDIKYNAGCTTFGETKKYVDNSGANKPVLYDNMVPIRYENDKWIITDLYTKWYDYDLQEWANAVVLNSGTTKSVGQEVTESDIALWYVWIPRYKYTIFNGNNESVSEQLINVTFENGTSRTGTVTCVDDFTQNGRSEICSDSTNGSIVNGTSTYTHPAFKFGDTELTGFWVGKFEVSTTDSTCNSSLLLKPEYGTSDYDIAVNNCNKVSTINIKPNVSSLRYTQVSNFFTSIQNIKTTYGISNADSHMIKNMDWGAVAYLKQSKYGLGTEDITINNNSSYYTGGGQNNAYKTNVGQSTTGNIYGVYDMSGGTYEYVMGNMLNENNEFYASSSGLSSDLDSKYYDTYKNDSSNTTHARGKLGDATKETLKTFGNESGGWYSDYAYFPQLISSWFLRGGNNHHGNNAGVFYFGRTFGTSYNNFTTRAVLTAP